MPHRIHWEGHGVYRRFYGVVTVAEFFAAYKEMCRDVRYSQIRYIISDYLECEPAPDLNEERLRQFAQLERLRFFDSPDTVQANVATDPKVLGYVRYYESLRISPYCMKDFATVADARLWIASHPRREWNPPPLQPVQHGPTAHH